MSFPIQAVMPLVFVLAFIHQPVVDDKNVLDEYIGTISESYEPTLLDSCQALIERLEENVLVIHGADAQDEFRIIFELLESIEPDSGSYEEMRLNDLTDRAKRVFAEYLHYLNELPEDVDPSFIWEEIDTLTSMSVLGDVDYDIFGTGELLDSIEIEQDEGEIALLSEKLPPIPVVMNKRVERAIKYFCNKGRKVMQLWLDRSAEMIPIILPILREEGMPDDLVYLAMIESGFNPRAYSWAHASGPWQFIAPTGRRYGLDIDWWYDERRNPELSTRAAAGYLRDLYAEFGDWFLALAAYNCGEGKVRRHVRQYGRDFWSMQRLPRQTRNYIPTYLGALTIARDPESYGFSKKAPVQPPEIETVYIKECVDLSALAQVAMTDVITLRKLNPAIVRWCTPPNRDSIAVFFPVGSLNEGFWDRYADIPREKKVSYVRHKVRRGQTLSTIARRYGVPMSLIIRHPSNHIRNRHRIRAGQVLIIPGITPERAGKVKKYSSEPYDTTPSGDVHIVRRGETLSGIASRYGVTVSQLKRLNGLYGKRYIYPRQRLRIYSNDGSGKSVVNTEYKRNMNVHVVTRGDTLWSISRMYGISVELLRRANGLQGRTLIKPGQKLSIPKPN